VITVKDLMTTDLVTLKESESLETAREVMTERRLRHIPVLNEDSELVGLLTLRDVVAASVSALAGIDEDEQHEIDACIPISAVMNREPAVVEEDTSLREAGQYMVDNKLGCLPVVSANGVVGIITDADFVALAVQLLSSVDAMDQPRA
jgi:CBS domain-containing membrane protein